MYTSTFGNKSYIYTSYIYTIYIYIRKYKNHNDSKYIKCDKIHWNAYKCVVKSIRILWTYTDVFTIWNNSNKSFCKK